VIVTQTPLRVGLVGGGTDLPGYYREHGGRVLNVARLGAISELDVH